MGNLDFGCVVPLPDSICLTPLFSLQYLFTFSPFWSTFVHLVHKVLVCPSPSLHIGSSLGMMPREVDAIKKGIKGRNGHKQEPIRSLGVRIPYRETNPKWKPPIILHKI